jgi:transcriptional regulator GlxA family with amidase domain
LARFRSGIWRRIVRVFGVNDSSSRRRKFFSRRQRARASFAQKFQAALAEIAAQCGYKSSSHLRKIFERRMKMPMGAWRRAHRK